MKTLVISEEQMTFVLKAFLQQYAGAFDHASFDDSENGYVVHFHQSPERAPVTDRETQTRKSNDDDLQSYLPPLSIPIPDFGGSSTPDFGGFGGGSSGGGGATGDW